MIKAILFDLDGTLLPMNQDQFVMHYIQLLMKKAKDTGNDPKSLIDIMGMATKDMVNNNGKETNEKVFYNALRKVYNTDVDEKIRFLEQFYLNEFEELKNICNYSENAKEAIEIVKKKGYKVVLATNPVFPRVATQARIKWAGLVCEDFDLYTTYENSNYCKPNINYYKQILKTINCKANECLMVGNDIDEDMIASDIGIKTFLLTDCLINRNNENISKYQSGNFDELINYLNTI